VIFIGDTEDLPYNNTMKPLINQPSIIISELNKDNHAILLQADDALMADKTIITYLIKSCPKYAHRIYAFASIELKNDLDILEMSFTRICQAETFNVLPKTIQNSKPWMVKAVGFNPYIFNLLSDDLKKDLDFNLECSKVVRNFSKVNLFAEILNNEKFIWEVAINSEREVFYDSILNKIEDSTLKAIFLPLYEESKDNNDFLILARKKKLEQTLVSNRPDTKKIKI
jgi:hypothetical protein